MLVTLAAVAALIVSGRWPEHEPAPPASPAPVPTGARPTAPPVAEYGECPKGTDVKRQEDLVLGRRFEPEVGEWQFEYDRDKEAACVRIQAEGPLFLAAYPCATPLRKHPNGVFRRIRLSLPAIPGFYYSDEIGMGHNLWLGDRDGAERLCSGRPTGTLRSARQTPTGVTSRSRPTSSMDTRP